MNKIVQINQGTPIARLNDHLRWTASGSFGGKEFGGLSFATREVPIRT